MGRYKVLEMSKDDIRSEMVPIGQEIAELNVESVRLDIPQDPELTPLRQELEETAESVRAQIESLGDVLTYDEKEQKIIEALRKASQEFAEIEKRIDQRFEELKAQIK